MTYMGWLFYALGAVSELYQAISILFSDTSPETPDLGVVSSAGRATRLHRVGRGFEPLTTHHLAEWVKVFLFRKYRCCHGLYSWHV